MQTEREVEGDLVGLTAFRLSWRFGGNREDREQEVVSGGTDDGVVELVDVKPAVVAGGRNRGGFADGRDSSGERPKTRGIEEPGLEAGEVVLGLLLAHKGLDAGTEAAWVGPAVRNGSQFCQILRGIFGRCYRADAIVGRTVVGLLSAGFVCGAAAEASTVLELLQ